MKRRTLVALPVGMAGLAAVSTVAFGQVLPADANSPTPAIRDLPPTPAPAVTLTQTVSPTPTPTVTETEKVSPTPTVTETETVSPTPTVTETETVSPTPTATVTQTATATPTPTPTSTGSPTPTPTPTVTGTPPPQVYDCAAVGDFGCGKLFVTVQPDESTYPSGQLPDLAGLEFDITDTTQTSDPDSGTCTTSQDTSDSGASCESDDPQSGPDAGKSWTIGDNYSVTLDASTPAPPNTVIPPVTGTFPDCPFFSAGCDDTAALTATGLFHTIGLVVDNSVTNDPVEGATYALCSATSSTPATGSAGCPSGSTSLATATTDSNGILQFDGLYPGSDNYSVVPTSVPSGYDQPGSQQLEVPPVTTAADTGSLFQGTAALPPLPPILQNQNETTPEGTATTFNVFTGSTPVSPPLTLTSLSTPSHGTATDPAGDVTYTPNAGFFGTDTFTYTATNQLGGSATATVTVKVTRVSPSSSPTPSKSSSPTPTPSRTPSTGPTGSSRPTPSSAPQSGGLPFTGGPIADEVGWAALLLAVGAWLTVGGRRRRRGRHALH